VLLAAGWVYLAGYVAIATGGLLHHPFTFHLLKIGGLLSVALALGLPRPSVRWNPALLQPGLSSCKMQATICYAHNIISYL